MPKQLYLPPSYHRAHFDYRKRRNEIVQLVGDADEALPIPQDLRVWRLMADAGKSFTYNLRSTGHGAYFFIREGSATVNGIALGRRDSAGFSERDDLAIKIEVGEDDSDIIIVETIMIDDDGIKVWEHDHVGH